MKTGRKTYTTEPPASLIPISLTVNPIVQPLPIRYHSTQILSEKSDVYSFGVVLLEVVTGQPVIVRSRTTAENVHITDRVESLLSRGDIKGIMDPKLGERFNAGSAWKITEVAMACASSSSKNRPTMSRVVAELKESVSRAGAGAGYSGTSSSFTEPAMTTFDSGMFPQARGGSCQALPGGRYFPWSKYWFCTSPMRKPDESIQLTME